MHLPEKRLRAYLDTFVSPAERERILDTVAEHALAHGVDDEPGLFRVAHLQLRRVRRRLTDAVEASVLAGEAGLTPVQIAAVLRPEPGQQEAAATVEAAATPVPRGRGRALIGILAAVVVMGALVWLGLSVLSGGGRAALSRRGVDPVVALPVAIGFLVGGAALIAASGGRRGR